MRMDQRGRMRRGLGDGFGGRLGGGGGHGVDCGRGVDGSGMPRGMAVDRPAIGGMFEHQVMVAVVPVPHMAQPLDPQALVRQVAAIGEIVPALDRQLAGPAVGLDVLAMAVGVGVDIARPLDRRGGGFLDRPGRNGDAGVARGVGELGGRAACERRLDALAGYGVGRDRRLGRGRAAARAKGKGGGQGHRDCRPADQRLTHVTPLGASATALTPG